MLTIEVPDELAAPLTDQAVRRGVTPEVLALEHLRALLSPPPPGSPRDDGSEPRFVALLQFAADLPGAPPDLAAQHDHYLTGAPKR